MEETTCPLCHKELVNGKCDDCGYYVDTHVMDNQKREYYTENKNTYVKDDFSQNVNEDNKPKSKMALVKVFIICFSLFTVGILFGYMRDHSFGKGIIFIIVILITIVRILVGKTSKK